MYRRTDRQVPLIRSTSTLPSATRQRLEEGWPGEYQRRVLPLLLAVEDEFSALYCPDNGRPNWSVALMLGILLLEDANNLSDQAALDHFSYDLRWQHALDVRREDAYLSRRSLVDFRSRMAQEERGMAMMRTLFDRIAAEALDDLRLSVKEQRLDSTRIMSNIRTRGRGDLFAKTLRNCLRDIQRSRPGRYADLPKALRTWHEGDDEEHWFGEADASKHRHRAIRLATWMHLIRLGFKNDGEIAAKEPYQLVVRVLDEHCSVEPTLEPTVESDRVIIEKPESEAAEACLPDTTGETSGLQSPPEEMGTGKEMPDAPEAQAAVDLSLRETESSPAATAVAAEAEVGDGSILNFEPTQLVLKKEVARPGSSLQSPFDPDAGYGHKGPGYHVQIAETCNNAGHLPEIITDYAVHSAGESDHGHATLSLERLENVDRKPERMYLDGGYIDGTALLAAKALGCELHGPVNVGALGSDILGRDSWTIDPATGLLQACPAGHPVTRHAMRTTAKKLPPTLHAYIEGTHCRNCLFADRCVARAPNSGKNGSFHVEDAPRLRARDQRITEQRADTFMKDYRIRSGIEATNSELKRAHGLGQLRVRRRPKVEIAVASKLTACNIKRWIGARVEQGAKQRRAAPGPGVSA